MGSIPVRTAKSSICIDGGVPVFHPRKADESLILLKLPDSVIGNIPEFESGVFSSILNPVTYYDVGFSLSVKHPSVQRRNRVRIPKSTKVNGEWSMVNIVKRMRLDVTGNTITFLSF